MASGGSLVDTNRWAWSRVVAHVKRRDRFTCQRCGAMYRLEVDHIVPRRLGGSDHPDNLRTLCHDCHVNREFSGAQAAKPSPLTSARPTIFSRPKVL
jgi:5-methylcytosine-specific restriction endonuclease McrA